MILAVVGVAVALGRSYPESLLPVLTAVHWPLLHGSWMSLIQLSYFAFVGALIALAVTYARQPARSTPRSCWPCSASGGCCPRSSSCPTRCTP